MNDSFCDVITPHGLHPLKIECKSHTSEDVREANVKANIVLDVPRLQHQPWLAQCRKGSLAIVGGGPSLRRHLDEVRRCDAVLACASTHDFLVDHGIIPHYAAFVDSLPGAVNYLTMPQRDTVYLLASLLEPKFFEKLKDHQVLMFHVGEQVDHALYGDEKPLAYGCACGINALGLGLCLGYQDFHIFGFDGNYEVADGRVMTHAYDVSEDAWMPNQAEWVSVGERRFLTHKAIIVMLAQFFSAIEVNGRYHRTTIHGDGMLAEMVRGGNDSLKQLVQLAA